MPATNEIEVDEDVIQGVVDQLHRVADHLDELAKTAEAQYDNMRDQLKGDNGKIPPVYDDIAAALHATSARLQHVNAAVTEKIRHDAATLLKTATTHGDIQREAAAQFNDTDTDFGAAHAPGAPPNTDIPAAPQIAPMTPPTVGTIA